jgi:SAM-dependent methyltransferase
MDPVPPTDAAAQRELVRRGYDAISRAYRGDDGAAYASSDETTATYVGWLEELAAYLPSGAHVLDIGCGAGVPADRWLVDVGFAVTGVDISEVQVERARRLVPEATFVVADVAAADAFDVPQASVDAVISLYALIHVPLEDQRRLFPRIHRWLQPGGLLLAIVGHERWTGVEPYLGAPMFWDHADAATYLAWLEADGFAVMWSRFVPEGTGGHTLVLARKGEEGAAGTA